MKKTIIFLAIFAALLTACAQGQIHFADPGDVEKALAESDALAASVAAEDDGDGLDLTATAVQDGEKETGDDLAEKETEAGTVSESMRDAGDMADAPESAPHQTAEPQLTEPQPIEPQPAEAPMVRAPANFLTFPQRSRKSWKPRWMCWGPFLRCNLLP